ncbi:MAG TPA: MBL fold metallo-hydrolase [Mycobacteriales bacterium]|jgi:flavorubredoxin|nr:MBL fold metallo-hydrolase [Mycobacteriales bacterium]
MTTKVDEIAPGIYRLSTLVPDIGPDGFTFNQFLVVDDEPLLFHTGHRSMFPSVRDAIETVLPLQRLRWITFGHVESDECGAMNEFLAAAPDAQVAHGALGCMVSLNEMADRPPRPLGDGEVLETGSKRFRHLDTPHVPHNWESRVLFEETTGTLFAGDLFTHFGNGPALTDSDVLGPAMVAEDMMNGSSLSAATPATVARLAELTPTTMALMHGSSYSGDCAAALRDLAADYSRRIAAAR